MLNTKLSEKADKGSISYTAIDTISESGLYRVIDTSGTLLHLYWDTNYSYQLFHRYSTGNTEFRYKRTNVWSDWLILCTTKIESVAVGDWFTLDKTANIVTARINTVRTSGLSKDTRYDLGETIPIGYRPPGTIKTPVRLRAGNMLSTYSDGIMEFFADGTIRFYANQDITSTSQFEIDGCASWPAAS